jgi:hypothetical protein
MDLPVTIPGTVPRFPDFPSLSHACQAFLIKRQSSVFLSEVEAECGKLLARGRKLLSSLTKPYEKRRKIWSPAS